jgi:hypothetical protein
MAGLMQDVIAYVRGKPTKFTTDKRMKDGGWFDGENDLTWFSKYFDEKTGVVDYNEDGTIASLNLDSWSQADKIRLGVINARHVSQVIQKSYVGELSPEMMNPTIAFAMQFKQYMIQAAEKQQVRQMNFLDKELMIQMAINTITSAISRELRYLSLAATYDSDTTREMVRENTTGFVNAFKYTNMAGVFDMYNAATKSIWDYNQGNLDGGEAIFNGFNNPLLPPVFNYASNSVELVKDKAKGEPFDIRQFLKLIPHGTTWYSNILYTNLKDAMEEDK